MQCHPIVDQQKVDMGVYSSNKSGVYIWKDLMLDRRIELYVKLQKIPRVVRGKILRDHSHV